MKKALLFSMLFYCTLSFSQLNDTIFLKNGEVIPVYKITKIDSKYITYITGLRTSDLILDMIDVLKYTKSELPEIQTNEQTNISKVNPYLIKNSVYRIEGSYYEQNYNKNDIDYKIGWIQYNLGRYYKQKRTSQIFYGLSFISGIAYFTNIENNLVFSYISGGLGLVGFVIDIDSYKWIKRASIEPTLNGVSIKVKL